MLGIGTLYIYIFYFINKQTKKKFKRSMFYDKISFYRHYNQDSRMLINLPEITVCILPLCFDEEGQNRNRPITIKCLQHMFSQCCIVFYCILLTISTIYEIYTNTYVESTNNVSSPMLTNLGHSEIHKHIFF